MREHLANGVGGGGQPQFVSVPHHLLDLEQLASEAAGRVIAREVLVRELPQPAQDEGERVSQSNHRRGTGAGGQSERANFVQWTINEGDVGLASEGAVVVA